MATPLINKRLISREEYHKMDRTGPLKPDENVELIHGEILAMAPLGSRQLSTVNKFVLFVRALSDECIISIQNPIHTDHWNESESDVVVLKYRADE